MDIFLHALKKHYMGPPFTQIVRVMDAPWRHSLPNPLKNKIIFELFFFLCYLWTCLILYTILKSFFFQRVNMLYFYYTSQNLNVTWLFLSTTTCSICVCTGIMDVLVLLLYLSHRGRITLQLIDIWKPRWLKIYMFFHKTVFFPKKI